MVPALINPKIIWITPAITTAARNNWKLPSAAIDVKTITVKPAAGPETESCDPLIDAVTIPPIMPVINPAKSGAPEAKAIPRHKGKATKNTTILAGKSFCKFFHKKYLFIKLKYEFTRQTTSK